MAIESSNTWKILGLLITLAVVGSGAAVSYGVFYGGSSRDIEHLHEKMKLIEPDVKDNTTFRISATEMIKNLGEKVAVNTEAVKENTKVQLKLLLTQTE